MGMLSLSIQAQSPNDLIDLQQPNYDLLQTLIEEKINKLRVKKRCSSLKPSNDLSKAATLHNNWLKGRKKLTHYQPSSKYKKASDRVKVYSRQFVKIGENIQYLGLGYEIAGRRKRVISITYEAAAKQAFKNWKQSKGHYRNLIDKDYKEVGTAITYDAKNFRIYVTQVYGLKQ